MSSSSLAGIRGPASATDNAVMRWDGSSGLLAQDSDETTLSDAGVLSPIATASQVVVGSINAPTVLFSGVTLTPRAMFVQGANEPLQPCMINLRASATGAGAPTFNYMRARGTLGGSEAAVQNLDTLGIFSGNGHDGTDYAGGAQIDMVVDEADTGTSAVGSNQMGSRIRFLTSRRGTAAPAFSGQFRHNGAFQLNTAMVLATLTATGMSGSMEVDTKCLYYTPEDAVRGVVRTEYFVRLNAVHTLADSVATQPMFDSISGVTNGAVTLPVGLYFFDWMASLSAMSATSGNALISFQGTATLSDLLWQTLGAEIATGTISPTQMAMMVTTTTPSPMVNASTATVLQFSARGTFAVTTTGTVIPSITLANGSVTPAVAIGSYFRCWLAGADTVEAVGPWS